MQFVVIGHPETSRVIEFCEAARDGGLPAPIVIPWHEVLHGRFDWIDRLPPNARIRIESPGRNWPTELKLLKLGAGEPDEEDNLGGRRSRFALDELDQLSETPGRILALRQWFLGWRRALTSLATAVADRGFQANWTSPPDDIIALFDKETCQARLTGAGCPMPPSLGVPANFEDLYEQMRAVRRSRVILKSCHSSSASCAVALEFSGNRIQAFSTVDLVDHPQGLRLYNVRPGRWYRDLANVRRLVDAVCLERVQAQVWIPKLGWGQKRVDLRVVTIGGRARHTVVRLSSTPFTNLQLHNSRGDLEAFRSAFGEATLEIAWEAAERVAQCFPRCLHLGIDVALTSRSDRAWILEANAFGDYLPNCLAEGWNTHRWQIETLRNSYVSAIGR